MKKECYQQNNSWLFQLSYQVAQNVETVWALLASNQGLALWFEELSIEQDCLIFQMEDFREEMAILTFQPQTAISFDWAGAQVTFKLKKVDEQSTQIDFSEIMPFDFPHPHRDLTGWAVQNERLEHYFRLGSLPDKDDFKDKWQNYFSKYLKTDS